MTDRKTAALRAVAVIYQGHVIIRGPIKIREDGRAEIKIDQMDSDGKWPYPPAIGSTMIVNSWGYL